EECCGAWVVGDLPPRAYAGAILEALDFLAGAPTVLPAAASGLGRLGALKRRLTSIMQRSTPKRLSASGWLVVLTLGVLLPILPTTAQSKEEKSDPQTSKKPEPSTPRAIDTVADSEPLTFGPSSVGLLGGNSDIWCVTVSRDGKLLAAGTGWWDRPGDVRVWDLARRRLLGVYPDRLGVASVAFSPDGRLP